MRLYEFLVAAAVCGLNKPWSGAEAHRGSVAVTPKRARNQTSKRAAIQTIRNVNISLVISTNRHEEVRSYIRRLFSEKILKRRCALANATPYEGTGPLFFFFLLFLEGIYPAREEVFPLRWGAGGFTLPDYVAVVHSTRSNQHTQHENTFRPRRSFSGANGMVGM